MARALLAFASCIKLQRKASGGGRALCSSALMMSDSLGDKFKVALLQVAVGADKEANKRSAKDAINEAAKSGAALVMLPECFNCPYDNKCFPEYAEEVPEAGTTLANADASSSAGMLQAAATENKVFVVGGSIPERSQGRIYNTSISVSPGGTVLAKHRKVHLFDIDVPGGIRFQESEVLSAGNSPTTFQAGSLTVGVGICYDIRFPELTMISTKEGAQLMCVPGAFNMTTGPAHWELLMRSRALDNQIYVAACSPARDEGASYVAWGHSMVCNPWGQVTAQAGAGEEILYADIDLEQVRKVRQSIPLKQQKRGDMYVLNRL